MTSRFSLLSTGSNAHGHLGNGSLEDSHIFQKCSFLDHLPNTLPTETSRIVDIATGANHTLVLLEIDGGRRELWGCGDGRMGQLGRAYQQSSTTTLFRKLDLAFADAGLQSYYIKFISATWETSFVVLSCDGQTDVVLSMGSDDFGDLGIGGLKKGQPAKDFHIIRFDHIPALSESLDVLGIYCGQRHVILRATATPCSSSILVGWGSCRHGQLGDLGSKPSTPTPQIVSTPTSNVVSLALGIYHTVALDDSGVPLCLGSNRKGQLEVVRNFTNCENKAQSIGCTWNGTYIVAQDQDQWTIYSSGSNSHKQLGWSEEGASTVDRISFPDELDRHGAFPKVACGSEHVLLLVAPTSTGPSQLWGWGWNEHGNLGVGHTDDVPAPIKLWAPHGENSKIVDVWAGLGTSWICVEENGA
ncbi:regulator of chromosome condensation 1/beta-lactamase-inhibitor protein II [Pholiota molesta]|nr:regulator of chromosome condensation 1/beta-lactamase-inhibitor protein II [Pholiota molesta]